MSLKKHGEYNPKTGKTSCGKGASQVTRLHEEYHKKANHPFQPRSARVYANQEIDATLHAYNKLGRPAGIVNRARGIFVDIGDRYNLTPSQRLPIIKSVLSRKDIPQQWRKDYKKIEKEYNKLQREHKPFA